MNTHHIFDYFGKGKAGKGAGKRGRGCDVRFPTLNLKAV